MKLITLEGYDSFNMPTIKSKLDGVDMTRFVDMMDDDSLEGFGRSIRKRAAKKAGAYVKKAAPKIMTAAVPVKYLPKPAQALIKKTVNTAMKLAPVVVPIIAKVTGTDPKIINAALQQASKLAKGGKLDTASLLEIANTYGIKPDDLESAVLMTAAENETERGIIVDKIKEQNPEAGEKAELLKTNFDNKENEIEQKTGERVGTAAATQSQNLMSTAYKLYKQGVLK